MRKDVPAILLVGGGEGMGALEATVRHLDAALAGSAQVAVICGRNRRLLDSLRSTVWPGGSHVVAVGFVDNVHEWMGAADVIITKAGPGTIAEALISGLPILLNGNVPCQVGRVCFVCVVLSAGRACCCVWFCMRVLQLEHPLHTHTTLTQQHTTHTGGGQHPLCR